MKNVYRNFMVAAMLATAGNGIAGEKQLFASIAAAALAGTGLLCYAVNWHANQAYLSARVQALEDRLRNQGQNQAVAQPQVVAQAQNQVEAPIVDNQNVELNVEGQAVQPAVNNALVPVPENNESRITWKAMAKAAGIAVGVPVATTALAAHNLMDGKHPSAGMAVQLMATVAGLVAAPLGISLGSAYLHQYGSPKQRTALKILGALSAASFLGLASMIR